MTKLTRRNFLKAAGAAIATAAAPIGIVAAATHGAELKSFFVAEGIRLPRSLLEDAGGFGMAPLKREGASVAYDLEWAVNQAVDKMLDIFKQKIDAELRGHPVVWRRRPELSWHEDFDSQDLCYKATARGIVFPAGQWQKAAEAQMEYDTPTTGSTPFGFGRA